MLTRRQLMKRGAIGGAVVLAPSGLWTRVAAAQGVAVTRFVDACPTPGASWPVIDKRGGGAQTLVLQQFQVPVHSLSAPTTNVWGYVQPGETLANRSTYLGPTLLTQRAKALDVTYDNRLPTTPLFPADPELVPPSHVDSRINTHLHGGHVVDTEDGNPFNAYPPPVGPPPAGQQLEVPPGTALAPSTQTMSYPNDQWGTLLWYHDHALGITRTNVYAGLAGGYLLTEPPGSAQAIGKVPTALDLSDVDDPYDPGAGKIPLHIPLVIQDKDLDAQGQLVYPFPWAPEFFGTTCLVNGRAFPFLQVQPRVYRFTFLNGSQSRFYNLHFGSNVSVTQIGVELGPTATAEGISNILIAPAERADVIVDFSKQKPGKVIELTDRPLPAGVVSPTRPMGVVMEFRVVGPALTGPDPFAGAPTMPGWTTASPTPRPAAPPAGGYPRAKVTFEEVVVGGLPKMAVVNGTPFMLRDDDGAMTDTPSDPWSTETVTNRSTVEWLYLNLTADSHPFHTHLAHFEVMERWRFNAGKYLADLNATRGLAWTTFNAVQPGDIIGRGKAPAHYDPANYPDPFAPAYSARLKQPNRGVPPQEKGPKDTVIANPGEITVIRLVFNVVGSSLPQQFVFHCHILEHEENEMMRPILVNE
jgi:spore coat protein A, manganese oxidase